jgi:DNA-binding transcriptional ArsR family regulator
MAQQLSKRNLILITIRKEEKTNDNAGLGFNELVLKLKGKVSRATISKGLDSLFDMGMLDSTWKKNDSKWQKMITVANETRALVDEMITNLKERKILR